MISRNQEKIDNKIAELKRKYPDVKYLGVPADLSKMTKIAEYRDLFDRPDLKNIDIGFVCLNAGTYAAGPVDKVNDAEFEAQYTLNVLHTVYLTKALLSRLLTRP